MNTKCNNKMLPRMLYISTDTDMHSMHFKYKYTRIGHEDIVKHTQDKGIQVPISTYCPLIYFLVLSIP